jgi:hypothetical protein
LCTAVILVAGCSQWEGRESGDPVKDTSDSGDSVEDTSPGGIFGPTRTVIGVDGPDRGVDLFGQIIDIEVDADANVYVLDRFDKRVRVFDLHGAFLGAAGQEGDGPGEFRGYMYAASDTGGLVHVVDRQKRRLYTLELADSGLVFRDEVQLDFPPADLCAVQGRRFLLLDALAGSTGLLIREVDARGEVVNAFGEREKPDGPFSAMGDWDYYVNYGSLACDTERVILVSKHRPLVRAFSLDGQELWRQPIPSYHEQRVELRANGKCCRFALPDPESGTYHFARGVATDTDHLFVSLMEENPADRAERNYELRILDARTGKQVASQETVGPVAQVDSRFVYAFRDEPFPQIVIYARQSPY